MIDFQEQFNNFKKELMKSLGMDETICEFIDSYIEEHKEEYNKLQEKIWGGE